MWCLLVVVSCSLDRPTNSFDDSSSISSGISDLNEIPTDLTSSSVNSEVSSPYASLQVKLWEIFFCPYSPLLITLLS